MQSDIFQLQLSWPGAATQLLPLRRPCRISTTRQLDHSDRKLFLRISCSPIMNPCLIRSFCELGRPEQQTVIGWFRVNTRSHSSPAWAAWAAKAQGTSAQLLQSYQIKVDASLPAASSLVIKFLLLPFYPLCAVCWQLSTQAAQQFGFCAATLRTNSSQLDKYHCTQASRLGPTFAAALTYADSDRVDSIADRILAVEGREGLP